MLGKSFLVRRIWMQVVQIPQYVFCLLLLVTFMFQNSMREVKMAKWYFTPGKRSIKV